MDVGLIPGRVLEDDPQRLLAAVDLERDRLAVLGLDLALGQGRADQALDAGVVDLAGQAEPRVGAAAAVGELGLGAEEVVVGIGGGVEEAVDRLRLPPAIEPLAFDPGELGQGVDQLGLGAALGEFFEVLSRAALTSRRYSLSRSNRLSVSSVRSLGRSRPATLRCKPDARSPRLG